MHEGMRGNGNYQSSISLLLNPPKLAQTVRATARPLGDRKCRRSRGRVGRIYEDHIVLNLVPDYINQQLIQLDIYDVHILIQLLFLVRFDQEDNFIAFVTQGHFGSPLQPLGLGWTRWEPDVGPTKPECVDATISKMN